MQLPSTSYIATECVYMVCILGEIIPLRITEKTLPWGQHPNLIGHLRLLLYTPLNAQSSRVTEVHENNGHGLVATYW